MDRDADGVFTAFADHLAPGAEYYYEFAPGRRPERIPPRAYTPAFLCARTNPKLSAGSQIGAPSHRRY